MITWHESIAHGPGGEEYPAHMAYRGDSQLAVISQDQVTHNWVACTPSGFRLAESSQLHLVRLAVLKHYEPCVCVDEAITFNRPEPLPCRVCGRGQKQQPRRRPMARAKKTKEKPDNGEGQQKTERFQQTLRCELPTEEVAKRADRAAHLVAEHEQKRDDLDALKKQAKAELDRIEAEHKALSAQVRDKAEYRSVECEKILDFKRWQVTVVRFDTFETVTERPMTQSERQQAQEELDLGESTEEPEPEEAEA